MLLLELEFDEPLDEPFEELLELPLELELDEPFELLLELLFELLLEFELELLLELLFELEFEELLELLLELELDEPFELLLELELEFEFDEAIIVPSRSPTALAAPFTPRSIALKKPCTGVLPAWAARAFCVLVVLAFAVPTINRPVIATMIALNFFINYSIKIITNVYRAGRALPFEGHANPTHLHPDLDCARTGCSR